MLVYVSGSLGGAENAELDIAEPDNAAPYSKGGQRGTGQYGTI